MAADVLAPCMARSLAAMALRFFVFHGEGFQLPSSEFWKIINNAKKFPHK